MRLKPDKTDLHYTKFLANDGRFKKIVDNTTYFNLVGFDPIHKTGISYFDVQVVSSLHRNIMIGVGSKEIKGMANAYTSP